MNDKDNEQELTSIGEIFGQMRSERSNTQDYYIGNRISRKTLWNFEHNLSNISYDSYLYLLNKLNVSPSEMDYLYIKNNKNQTEHDHKFQKLKFKTARLLGWRNADQKQIEQWIKESDEFYQKTDDFFYWNFSLVMKKLLKDKFIDDLNLKKETNQVADYLMKIETYSDLDLALFIAYLDHLNESLIMEVEQELIKRFFYDPVNYVSFVYYFVIRIKNKFRTLNFAANKKEIERYLKYLKRAVELVGNVYNIRVLFNFFDDLYKMKTQEVQHLAVNNHLEILRYFEAIDEYNDCYHLLNQVLFKFPEDRLKSKKIPFII